MVKGEYTRSRIYSQAHHTQEDGEEQPNLYGKYIETEIY